jgi:hypothetical protein
VADEVKCNNHKRHKGNAFNKICFGKYWAADFRQARGRLDAQGRHDRRTAGYDHVTLEGMECSHYWRILGGYNLS